MGEPRAAVWSALIASLGTLVCCALPALLVLLGLGSTVAALVSAAPWLVVLSQHKVWVFAASGGLIAGSRLYADHVAPRVTRAGASCPSGLGRWTNAVWWTAVALYGVGFFVAFLLGPMLSSLGV